MTFTKTPIQDCYIIEPNVFKDDRGYFLEYFNSATFEKRTGITARFLQDNISKSSYGVIRGLHFQKGEHSQAKLVSVIEGRVLDVVVDLRKSSPTFKEIFEIELTETNKTQLYVPRGCAHGFAVLSKTARFFYKCDNLYNKDSESGIIYNDETLAIDWTISKSDIVVSEKDKLLPGFKDAYNFD